MESFRLLAVVCLLVARVSSAPVDQSKPHNDLFAGLLSFAQLGNPPKESDIVKRRIYEENPDRALKQISLQSLINEMEGSMFASALSVHNVAHDQSAVIPEIRPTVEKKVDDHDVNKRNLVTESTPSVETATTTIPVEGEERRVILQTTERVPEIAGVPAHIIIDRIAIQPHHGNRFPLIPAFEIKHTRTENGEKVPEITKISISKTEITSVPNTNAPVTVTPATESSTTTTTETTTTATTSVESSTAAISTTSTTESTKVTPTTPESTTPTAEISPTTSSTIAVVANKETESTTAKNIEQLKEEEQELKEKVAEIEAEPIILSARV
ncbi:uncharacterized protein LOC133328755 [Musca vetustissima]|uniref:uncharacterized protein LOC133328755 n=1 Tax=Musca vetustissima TaxID=27455 RepID=UPI002AB74DA7|nr:uncharacterized protein LOC133328755 [Musca vetustissima]